MLFREFTFLSSDTATPIHAVQWLPEGEVRCVVQIAHGISEHILRYAPFAEYLTQQGIAVTGNDHIGHGSSVVPGAPRLYFGRRGSWDHVVDDVEALRAMTQAQFPHVPYVLLGHSMGSFLARTHLIRYPGTLSGAIVMGTGQMPAVLVTAGRALSAFETLRLGPHGISPLVQKVAFGPYNRRFAPNRTAFDWLSANPHNVDAYIADPLCGESPTVSLFHEMLRGIAFIRSSKNLRQMDVTTPVLFISGEDDPVGDYGNGVRQAADSFFRAGMSQVEVQLYPTLRHEILNELSCQQVYDDLCRWLCTHCL